MTLNPDALVTETYRDPLAMVPSDAAEPLTTATAVESASSDHHDRIARRAYALYLSRGAADGWDMQDWLDAERQINADNPLSES